MSRIEIDDLLRDVSPALVAGYEQKHGSRLLACSNEAYKVIFRLIEARRRKYVILGLSLITGIVFIAYAGTGDIGMILKLCGFGALMVTWMLLVFRSLTKAEEAASFFRDTLVGFRKSVEALNMETPPPYTEDSVRAMLVEAASWLLVAQRLLEKYGGYSAEDQAVNAYRAEETLLHVLREDQVLNFDQRAQAVAEFGLVFKKAELFRDAAAILDRRS